MIAKIQRFLQWLIAGSFSLLIAACYGPPMRDNMIVKDITVKDKNNNPIRGASLTMIYDNNVTNVTSILTSEEGKGRLWIGLDKAANIGGIKVLVDDDSYEDNFEPRVFNLSEAEEYVVILKKKKK